MSRWSLRGQLPIGEVHEGDIEPDALLVPTAEFINPYQGLSQEEKDLIMSEVEKPPTLETGPLIEES